MNSNYKKFSNPYEQVWQATQRSINLSKAVLLLGMAEYFRLGKKRMEDFLNFYNDFAEKHMEYEHDGIHIEKINEALEKYDTSFEALFEVETLEQAKYSIKKQKKSQNINYGEALAAQKKIKAYARWAAEKMEGGNK